MYSMCLRRRIYLKNLYKVHVHIHALQAALMASGYIEKPLGLSQNWKKIISVCDLFKIFDVYFL